MPRPSHQLNKEYIQDLIRKYSILNADTDCWIWSMAKTSKGYGTVSIHNRMYFAHRLSLWAFGKLEDIEDLSIQSRHRMDVCSSKACVNPEHLEVGSQYENFVDSVNYNEDHLGATNFSKVACTNGHPFSEENTIYERGKSGLVRRCRACRQERDRNRVR
jgi:hypothetical protein